MTTSPSSCTNDYHKKLLQEAIMEETLGVVCTECFETVTLIKCFPLTIEEVKYLVDNIQHEYLNKDTYYFSSDLFGRMQRFLDELAGRDSQTT